MKNFVGKSVVAFVGSAALAATAFAESKTCEIKFELDSAVPNQSDIDNCLKQTEGKIDFAFVAGNANSLGTYSYNYNLAERRAQAIAEAIRSQRPDATVETIAAGEGPDTLSSTVVLSASEPSTVAVVDYERSSTLSDAEAGVTPDTHSMRYAIRLGNDNYDVDAQRYPSAGLDLGYVRNNVLFQNMRLETGATGSVLQDAGEGGMDQVAAASSHAYIGPGFGIKSFVVGARGLAGAVWDSENKWQMDTGGEGRIGFENESFSIFAGMGRTTYLTRLGVDIGVNF